MPVLVSGKVVSQLLTVAKLPSETGESRAAAVFGAIQDCRGVADSIRAIMCFDTTSSNSGQIAGAYVLLEQKLEKELLSLTCRHHNWCSVPSMYGSHHIFSRGSTLQMIKEILGIDRHSEV